MSWGEIKKKCLQQTLSHSHSAIEDCTERNKRSFNIELTPLSLSRMTFINYKEITKKLTSKLLVI